MPPRRTRSLLVAAITLIAVMSLPVCAPCEAACDPPLGLTVTESPSRGVKAEWFHPGLFADTLSAHESGYDRSFHVGDDLTGQSIAIRLPGSLGGRLVHAVRCYFIGADGIDSSSWKADAAFAWSLRADSADLPGSPIVPEEIWQLSSSPALRGGGWMQGSVNWQIPDSLTGPIWLVGRWPAIATDIVRVGADNGPAALTTLAGALTGTQGVTWEFLAAPGLMIEVVILSNSVEQVPHVLKSPRIPLYSIAGGPTVFVVETETLDGPRSPRVDTSYHSTDSILAFTDTIAAVGQIRLYRVAAQCADTVSGWAVSDSVSIEPTYALEIVPSQIQATVAPATDTVLALEFTNYGLETLSVQFERLMALSSMGLKGLSSEDSLIVASDVDSLTVLPGETVGVQLTPLIGPGVIGLFSGYLGFTVHGPAGAPVDNHLIYMHLNIDLQTGVEDGGEPGDVAPTNQSPLSVRSLATPFIDEIQIELSLRECEHGSSGSGLLREGSSLSEVEVLIVDVLGREVERESMAVIADGFALADGGKKQILRISGTRRWPSGVYFCRVRWGAQYGAVRLIHIK